MKKTKKILGIYAIIVIIALICILFIIPDSFFENLYKTNEIPTTETEPKEFTDYEEQKSHLLMNQYNYEYLLLDSMGTKTYTFECSGQKKDTLESGSCTSPTNISYTEKTKAEVFSKIKEDYINPQTLFEIIEENQPEETKYTTTREYLYKVKIEDLDTEITITTDLEEITKICIRNSYMTYILKYSNVSY